MHYHDEPPTKGLPLLVFFIAAVKFGEIFVRPNINVKVGGAVQTLLIVLVFLVLLLLVAFVVFLMRLRRK